MLEKIPSAVGAVLQGVRAGLDQVVAARHFGDVKGGVALASVAFPDGRAIPAAYTADGEDGAPPPLSWSGCPAGTVEVVLIAEDADSPTPHPLVHLIAYGLSPGGELGDSVGGRGRNSFGKAAYLPPDPPSGHGAHRYVFQIFALDRPSGLSGEPGRDATVEAMRGKVVAKGTLIGLYERP